MLIPGVRDAVKTLQTKPLEAQELLDGLQGDVQGAIKAIDEKAQGVRLGCQWGRACGSTERSKEADPGLLYCLPPCRLG